MHQPPHKGLENIGVMLCKFLSPHHPGAEMRRVRGWAPPAGGGLADLRGG